MLINKLFYKIYASKMFVRYDGNPAFNYFTHEDFDGLLCEKVTFPGPREVTLSGAYYYIGEKSSDRVVIFEHGMGNGHRAYMREIYCLARHGYTVFAYDHTGCMESGGTHINGLTGSLPDLDKAVSYLKSAGYSGKSISVVGHSWGGFSTLNIPALHPDLRSCVAISGFIHPSRMIEKFFPGFFFKKCRTTIMIAEDLANPGYFKYNAIDSLKDTEVRMLIIHSEDDPLVDYKDNFEAMRSALISNDNVSYIRLNGHKHNPNYTVEAAELLDSLNRAHAKLLKKKPDAAMLEEFRNSRDWWAVTEQDQDVWDKIFAHLDAESADEPLEEALPAEDTPV